MPNRRVAACVVTGFLGSGKTTLLRSLLRREPSRERIAVVVNELGEIGIDGRVLTGFEFVENVVEFASGCVCCSIDEYRFDLAIDELVRRVDPVLVVLETTGVADPAPAVERLKRCGLGVDAVITVVDAMAWKTAWRVSAVARRQIEAADFVVLSKTDLVTAGAVAKLRRRIAAIQPRALVLEGAGEADFEGSALLLATSAARRTLAARPAETGAAAAAAAGLSADHLADDRIESFSWRSPSSPDRGAFERMLKGLPPSVLRAKGFLRDRDEERAWLFQLVCGRVELSMLEGSAPIAAGIQAVFLGTGISALRRDIVQRIESCAGARAPLAKDADEAPGEVREDPGLSERG